MDWCSHSPGKHEWAVKTRVSIVYLQLKFDEIQNDYLTQTLVFLAGVEMKKYAPSWENWVNSFISREWMIDN